MQTRTDDELLRDYAVAKSETAFGEILRRYADFVYSAALRQVGNNELARDLAQIVFSDFARKAPSLKKGTVLIGWFINAARLAALEQIRTDQRRLQRERQSMDLLQSSSDTSDDWTTVRPVLDEVLTKLSTEDRDALLLRFFKNESLAAIGAILDISEDAAQKRVSRALGKLREFLAERGINTTAAALSAALIANGVQAAPGGFAASLAAGALKSAAVAGSSTAPLLKLFTASNFKAAAVVVALVASVAWIAQRQVKLQRDLRESQALTQQRMAELDSLRATNAQLAIQAGELEQLLSDAKDLLRLRAEITRLRQNLAEQKMVSSRVPTAVDTNAVLPEQQITIRCRFISLPEANSDFSATGILTEPQFKVVLKSMQEKEGANVIGESQVTTLSGRQTQISVPFAGKSGNASSFNLSLDLLATCQTNPPEIQIEMANGTLSYFTGQPNPYSSPAYGGDQRNLFELTNSLTIWDGQTLVITRRLPVEWITTKTDQSLKESSLVTFVTPTLIDAEGNRLLTGESVATNVQSTARSEISVLSVPLDGSPGVLQLPSVAEPSR